MKKSATGLVLGSALVLGLSGCASSNPTPSGSDTSPWYQNKLVCGLAGGIIGGGLGYSVSSHSTQGASAAVGAVAGATLAALLCKNPEPARTALDSDGDGVPDYLDQCPGTPAGVKVDARGCPIETTKERPTLVVRDVHFAFDSSKLNEDSRHTLNAIAKRLVANPDVRVRIEGHTDSIGTRAYNMGLSKRRANAVANYLASEGVAHSRMMTIGYGEDRPVASNKTAAGRAKNRRVEIAPIGMAKKMEKSTMMEKNSRGEM